MTDFYLWPTQAQAQAALDNINAHPAFPIQGVNAATGAPVPGSLTTCWADSVVLTADGRWGFPRIPSEFLDRMGISEANRAAWLAAFAPEIVTDPPIPSPSDPE